MNTRTDSFTPRMDSLHPLGSWEAAARWNEMTFEWMASGWRQWLQLLTAWPSALQPVRDALVTASTATPDAMAAPAGTQEARNARAVRKEAREARPRASEGKPAGAKAPRQGPTAAKRSGPKRPARAQAAGRSTTRSRA